VTEKLYYRSAYLTEFDAEVLSCVQDRKSWLVELDRTAFYPEGGGQPADSGRLGDASVTDVQEKDGHILHTCSRPLEPGSTVSGRIDWERRFDHMQQHSGEHIVSGMICSRFHCDNVGFHLGKDLVTIDYNAAVTMEDLKEIEDAANRYIWEDHVTEILLPDEEELKHLQYRSKKELSGEVRITSFPGADICACCGTHVSRSGEVGLVKFLSCQKFTKGSRIELLCGKRAMDFLVMNFEQNSLIARSMAASLDRTALVYQKQKEELIASKLRMAEMEKLHFEAVAAQHAGCGDVLYFEEGLSPDSVRRLSVLLAASCGGQAAVFSGEGSDYKYALTGPQGTLMKEFAAAMNSALSGKGGGRENFAQGSVKASRKQIETYFHGI
jgi:alanyl-tRNA synthetase